MKIVVGSKNPVKIKAVREVFEEVFGEVEVVGRAVKSGVSEQPMSDEETIRGARARARVAIKQVKDADYGIGLEGGVYDQDDKLYETAWCAIVRIDGVKGLGGGLRFEIPPKVAQKIREGGELGPLMDELLGRADVKQQEGAIGVLTKNRVTRTGAYQQLVYLALVRFISEEWYT